MKLFKKPITFEWDEWNRDKNLIKHRVTNEECEEVFFDLNKKILKDSFHSEHEARYILIGVSRRKRLLFVVFTIRKSKVRVISARDLNKKERHLYG